MKARSRRAVPLALVAALAVLLLPSSASAQPAESASLTMVSDPGDYIGQGLTWSYATEAGDQVTTSTNGNHVSVAVTGYNGDWWYLDFDAPIDHTLTAGTTYPAPPDTRSTGVAPVYRSTARAAAATS